MAEIHGLPLDGYHAFHASRAHLLRQLGRNEESRAAYDRAVGLALMPPRRRTSTVAATSWPARVRTIVSGLRAGYFAQNESVGIAAGSI